MHIILSTIVGSHLYGTATEDSDVDERGVFLVPLKDKLSPFRETKVTYWEESEEKDVSAHELTRFCKLCATGNPTYLEVLVGKPDVITPLGKDLQKLLPKFLSKNCHNAFLGYAKNQEKKFRARDAVADRKYKYASAMIRTLEQLLHLLKTGDLIGTFPDDHVRSLKAVEKGEVNDGEIMKRVFELEEQCADALKETSLPDEPDTGAIEEFIVAAYLSEAERRAL